MINSKRYGIKKFTQTLAERKNKKSDDGFSKKFSKALGFEPKNFNGFLTGDDEFLRNGKCAQFLSAVSGGYESDDWRKIFTPKQMESVMLLKNGGFRRLNILDGSVRSGKTYISLILWALMISTRDYNERGIMVGRTLTTLKRNCLELLQELVGSENFMYSVPRKEAQLFGRKIYLEGADNVLSEDKIRGMTLAGAYCDEITLLDENFFRMLLSRLSVERAFLLGTTNPDRPTHWLKMKYLDRADELDLLNLKYTIDDNTFLAGDYVSKIKKEYVGVDYDRFILGLWKAAEGVIYPLFADNPQRYIIDGVNPEEIKFATIGVDFGGTQSAHAFVLTGFTKGFEQAITLDEFYLKKQISPAELEREFISFARKAQERYRVHEAYCDSAESTLIKGLRMAAAREGLSVSVINARKNLPLERIRFTNRLMSFDRYKICKGCTHLIKAYQEAVWESNVFKDKRLDNGSYNVDSLDASEYSIEPYMDTMIVL